jgi:DNA-binding MarR family transcriptional regulator
MSDESSHLRCVQLAEQIGVLYEQLGGTRIAGRLLGWLVVCDPAEQSSAQLADALSASRGSVSTGTRALVAAGLIEKVRFPGDRSTYFRIRPGAWPRALQASMAALTLLRETAAHGLGDLRTAGLPEARLERLRELHDTYAFFERELPALIQRYRDQHPRAAGADDPE